MSSPSFSCSGLVCCKTEAAQGDKSIQLSAIGKENSMFENLDSKQMRFDEAIGEATKDGAMP